MLLLLLLFMLMLVLLLLLLLNSWGGCRLSLFLRRLSNCSRQSEHVFAIPLCLFEVSNWLGEEFEESSTDEVVALVQIEDFIKEKPQVNRVRVELPTEQLVKAVSKRFPTCAYVIKEVNTRAMYPYVN